MIFHIKEFIKTEKKVQKWKDKNSSRIIYNKNKRFEKVLRTRNR